LPRFYLLITKFHTMKKIYSIAKVIVVMFLLFAQVGEAFSQCPNTNTLYTDLTPAGVGQTNSTTVVYGGEYCTVSVCTGASYTFSTVGTTYDTQITLYSSTGTYLGYNDDITPNVTLQSSITWTSTFTGQVRVLVNEYNCISNTTFSSLSVTQNTACGGASCTASSLGISDAGCQDSGSGNGILPAANLTFNFTGTCSATTLYLSENGGAYAALSLTAIGITAGEVLLLTDLTENSFYQVYYMLSNGALSPVTSFSTGSCSCVASLLEIADGGCENNGAGLLPTLNTFYTFSGTCGVTTLYYSADGAAFVAIDLTASGITSGTGVQIINLLPNTFYEMYFVLSNGAESPSAFYTTGSCSTCAPGLLSLTNGGCENNGAGLLATVNTTYNFTGACNVSSLYITPSGGATSMIDLTSMAIVSGGGAQIINLTPNTSYTFYYTLSDGSVSGSYSYFSGACTTGCTGLSISHVDTGCYASASGTVPSGNIVPTFNGGCTVAGVYTSVNGGAYQYLDLSAYGFTSGQPMGLLFNNQNASYSVYYVLSDGTISPTTSFVTGSCASGETFCDCAGTQVPVEALSWLGDGFLDQGASYWLGVTPVDLNCATWGFDCGDQIAVGTYAYDPYGVCSGSLPPANGCVDEFCYSTSLYVSTDCHPEDITVNVFNANGNLVFTITSDMVPAQYTTYSFDLCLPAGCYTFQINDVFGDGLAGNDCTSAGFFGVYDNTIGAYGIYVDGTGYTTQYSSVYCVGPITVCDNLQMDLFEEPCVSTQGAAILPSVSMQFSFSGSCTVSQVYLSANGGAFTPIDVTAQLWGSGDTGTLINLLINTDYQIYYTTNDGAVSFLYNFTTGDCTNDITICDCDLHQHTVGVLDWLGDGYADNGTYQWAGSSVNFNCAKWGYDCGDIAGAPSSDPYGVCSGGLPPFNGCSSTTEVLGCTDPTALNYNALATINDGSCIYNLQEGCTDATACNYNNLAITDDGSCEYVTCAGCTNPSANNYDPTATIDDGSCNFAQIPGCMDATALNYNPLATVSDGSCIFSCVWPTVTYDSHCIQGDLGNFYVDVEVSALGNGSPYTITNSYNQQQLVLNLMGSFTMGPFPNNQQVVIYVNSYIQDCFLTSPVQTSNCSAGGVYGCMDPTALNYNPAATIDDGSCIFSSVEEVEAKVFGLYPNPANDQVTIMNGGQTGSVRVRMLDATGRIVYNEQVTLTQGGTYNVPTSELAAGNYVFEMITNGKAEHQVVVIQH
jgi:Secretion system C-terminal sorting domain